MKYTVYRAGLKTPKYDRGGVWYEFSKGGAEYYKRLYIINGRLSRIYKFHIDIYTPFFIEIGNLPESEYPYLAYYIIESNDMNNVNPEEAFNAYIVAKDSISKEYEKNVKKYEEDRESIYAYLERKLSKLYKDKGYDSIIFTDEGRFVQVFKFNP